MVPVSRELIGFYVHSNYKTFVPQQYSSSHVLPKFKQMALNLTEMHFKASTIFKVDLKGESNDV